jgi:hypothetical protein
MKTYLICIFITLTLVSAHGNRHLEDTPTGTTTPTTTPETSSTSTTNTPTTTGDKTPTTTGTTETPSTNTSSDKPSTTNTTPTPTPTTDTPTPTTPETEVKAKDPLDDTVPEDYVDVLTYDLYKSTLNEDQRGNYTFWIKYKNSFDQKRSLAKV